MMKLLMSWIVAGTLMMTAMAQEVKPDQIVKYKTVGDVSLDLHVFYPLGHSDEDRSPAIVFFFGGGWNGGSPTQFYRQSEQLASRGMVAICADYRTKKKHGTPPMDCVRDAKSVMRWVRSHAGELGVDPDRLLAGGGSAGGHLAAATAVVKPFNETGEDTSISCRPAALVLFNPVFDNGPDGYGHDRVQEVWQDFSPLHNLDETVPPTLVMLGTQDNLIPVATAEAWKAKMDELGVRCDLVLYEDQPHGFFNKAKFKETLAETDRFLTSLGYLPEK